MNEYPPELEILPFTTPPVASVRVPGSKSLTNRALILAAMAPERCEVHGALFADDTLIMAECLRKLGWNVESDEAACRFIVSRDPKNKRIIPNESADLFVGNSGTTMRFLAALVSLGVGVYRFDGVERMRQRPIGDLVDALVSLGARVEYLNQERYPPIEIKAQGWHGSHVKIRSGVSGQFVSGLVLAAPFADSNTRIEWDETLVSKSFVAMTFDFMLGAGIQFEEATQLAYDIISRQTLTIHQLHVEPDATAASCWIALAAITGGAITIDGIHLDMIQGDLRFAFALRNAAVQFDTTQCGMVFKGRPIQALWDVDMGHIPDTFMNLAAVAAFADGPTTIRNIAHVRHKESDRIAAMTAELRRLGLRIDEHADGMTVHPGPMKGCKVQTYDDHRIAMALALIGCRVPRVIIDNPGCVAKTYPGFFRDLEALR